MDRGAWQAIVHEVAKSGTLAEHPSTDTQLSVSGQATERSDDCHQV